MASILSYFHKKTKSNDKYYYKDAGVVVLGVNLHCEGCVKTVVKALRGFDGVEEVEPNMEENRVVVKGTACCPDKIAERVRSKLGKSVTIISPVPIKKAEKKQEKKQEKKEAPPKVTETVLKMHLHCKKCAKDVKNYILKLEGVQSVKPDMNASTMTVKGTVDPKDLITFINKKTKKEAEVVIPKKQKDQNQNQNQKDQNQNQNQNDGKEKDSKKKEKKESEKKDERTSGLSYPYEPRGLDYATEIFSDENPNACSIM